MAIPAPLWGLGEVGGSPIQGLAPLATVRGSSGARGECLEAADAGEADRAEALDVGLRRSPGM